ncbi:GGDEF domain-containing protein [Pseudodesulfovibrio thermohalotolerans]|uniref:GGDEF domain-containing protein n=1 Tax=Pseudodesulfovibrio thermohalotolerans TaxID=2880651 RepID=UPI0024419FA0|nr:GGDEF domain-containing protein [Pseudodesulfovibrio thermohalotolerans]WFS62025.1 GGDEF domain-containing protein [Pseudodesulfovibrio thermohalotolerans]
MSQPSKGRLTRQARCIFLLQCGLSVTVIVFTLLPVTLLNDREYALTVPFLAAVLLLAVALLCATRFMRLLRGANEKIDSLITHDELTGLPNRPWFFARLDEEIDRARRYGKDLALVMVDLDDFRRINDTFGHPQGDLALAEVARLLKANIRASDIAVRYGGEEFMVILPEADARQAAQAAEKLRMIVEVNDISLEGPEIRVTVSCGVADLVSLRPDRCSSRDALITAADRAMHQAKQNGRNQVFMHEPAHERQLTLV